VFKNASKRAEFHPKIFDQLIEAYNYSIQMALKNFSQNTCFGNKKWSVFFLPVCRLLCRKMNLPYRQTAPKKLFKKKLFWLEKSRLKRH
jgi:hypothetical protein